MTFSTGFTINGNPGHRTVKDWRHAGPTLRWESNALRYAIEHGEAKVLRANGKVTRFFRDETAQRQVRQRTYTQVFYDQA